MAIEQLCQVSDVIDLWAGFGELSSTRQQRLINAASDKILKSLRRGFVASQGITELLDGRNTAILWLRHRPIISVTSITISFDPLDSTAGTTLTNSDGNDWTLYPKSGKIVRGPNVVQARFGWAFPAGSQNIQVIYYAGWNAIPDPIIEGTAQYVRWLQERSKTSGVYVTEAIGDWSGTISENDSYMGLPKHVADLIMDYVQDDGPL